jgi:hypothetical protein
MPFEKGNKYGGARKVKPFRDALMMEIKAAGDDHKALRKIAAALLAKAANGDVPAINALADRTGLSYEIMAGGKRRFHDWNSRSDGGVESLSAGPGEATQR